MSVCCCSGVAAADHKEDAKPKKPKFLQGRGSEAEREREEIFYERERREIIPMLQPKPRSKCLKNLKKPTS